MYCRIENGEAFRPRVTFPEAITREIARVGQSQLLLARCCRQFDEETLIMREMVEFQKDLIFDKGRRSE